MRFAIGQRGHRHHELEAVAALQLLPELVACDQVHGCSGSLVSIS